MGEGVAIGRREHWRQRRPSLLEHDGTEAEVDTGLKRAARLRQAALKRAFEGKLVPQDPNDEPASVLLYRIRREREANPPARKRPKKGYTGEDGDGEPRRRKQQNGR